MDNSSPLTTEYEDGLHMAEAYAIADNANALAKFAVAVAGTLFAFAFASRAFARRANAYGDQRGAA